MTYCLCAAFPGSYKVVCRIDVDFLQILDPCSGMRIHQLQTIDFVAEKPDAHGVVTPAEINVHRIPAHPECPAPEVGFRARIKGIDQLIQKSGERTGLPYPHPNRLGIEIVGVAYAVEAAYAGYHYDVAAAAEQGARCAQAQFFYFIVYAEILLNISIGDRKVCLGLVIVVIGHEILYRIVGKERLEFSVQLCGKSFVMTEDKSRTLQILYDAGHCESLAGTRNS